GDLVTGVQTCALPISSGNGMRSSAFPVKPTSSSTMRICIADVAVEEDVGFTGNAELRMPFPEVTEFSVPTWILMLEPLEVLFGQIGRASVVKESSVRG